ncbi:hypothetical protein ESCO_005508 [Escovopsis weberi]|uniref:Uncharacterized protein n=1 Tax=Escovopsis weberi TaxID=150374 RepID=A0A0M9VV03_ESCWE|nr:hypothetical protein ESCO_005508 [Escovopsis weberi]
MNAHFFDTLFELTEEDLAVVEEEINSLLLACTQFILEDPPNYPEALKEADQAYALALAEDMRGLYPTINFFRAHCHRGLRNWVAAVSTTESLEGVGREAVQGLPGSCLDDMRDLAMEDPRQLRRVKAGEDLHARFFRHEKGKAVDRGQWRMLQ